MMGQGYDDKFEGMRRNKPRSLMGQWDDLRRAGRTKQDFGPWLEETAEAQQETILALQEIIDKIQKVVDTTYKV